MWRNTEVKVKKYNEKFGELTEENINIKCSNFSNMGIEDKIEFLLYILDSPNDSSFRTIRNHTSTIRNHTSNPDLRYHLTIIKKGNNFNTLMGVSDNQSDGGGKFKELSEVIEDFYAKSLEEKIELCKAFLLFKKIGLTTINKKISSFLENDAEIGNITRCVADSVLRNNSFDCNEQIINNIKAVERQIKMDEFLNENNNERLQKLLSDL